MTSLQGQLLVASPSIGDDLFDDHRFVATHEGLAGSETHVECAGMDDDLAANAGGSGVVDG
ncbi:MAG: hypothetical protein MK030_09620 [SAR116 cluster bacterium]|nr:hypothetical protein [SAR116 cluster bacterium]